MAWHSVQIDGSVWSTTTRGQKGYFAGFPNFHEADYGQGLVGGVHLLTSAVRRVARRAREPPTASITSRMCLRLFRGAATYAGPMGYPGAFPNCHQQDHGAGVVYGTILMKPGTVEWRDVLRSDLGILRSTTSGDDAAAATTRLPTVCRGVPDVPSSRSRRRGRLRDGRDPRPHGMARRAASTICFGRSRSRAHLRHPVPDARRQRGTDPDSRRPRFYERYFFGAATTACTTTTATSPTGTQIAGEVFGWLDIGHTLAEHGAIGGRRSGCKRSTGVERGTRIRSRRTPSAPGRCREHGTDWGGVALGRSMLLPRTRRQQHGATPAEHEFGHVLGLDDSFSTTTDTAGM